MTYFNKVFKKKAKEEIKKIQKKLSNEKIVVERIEKDKENRSKNIYCFTLSMTSDEEKEFNKSLKNLINNINKN